MDLIGIMPQVNEFTLEKLLLQLIMVCHFVGRYGRRMRGTKRVVARIFGPKASRSTCQTSKHAYGLVPPYISHFKAQCLQSKVVGFTIKKSNDIVKSLSSWFLHDVI